MNDVDAAKARLDEHFQHDAPHCIGDWSVISAELDRLRKQVVAFEQAAPRLYRCNDESCYLCDADMRYLFPGTDVAALREKEGA